MPEQIHRTNVPRGKRSPKLPETALLRSFRVNNVNVQPRRQSVRVNCSVRSSNCA